MRPGGPRKWRSSLRLAAQPTFIQLRTPADAHVAGGRIAWRESSHSGPAALSAVTLLYKLIRWPQLPTPFLIIVALMFLFVAFVPYVVCLVSEQVTLTTHPDPQTTIPHPPRIFHHTISPPFRPLVNTSSPHLSCSIRNTACRATKQSQNRSSLPHPSLHPREANRGRSNGGHTSDSRGHGGSDSDPSRRKRGLPL